MSEADIIEELLIKIEGAANMMRGMLMDKNIHNEAKVALANKVNELDKLVDKYA